MGIRDNMYKDEKQLQRLFWGPHVIEFDRAKWN